MVLYLGEFGNTVLSRSVGLEELVWLRQLKTLVGLTFVVNLLVSTMLAHTTVLDSRSQTSRVLRGVSPSLRSWLRPLSLC